MSPYRTSPEGKGKREEGKGKGLRSPQRSAVPPFRRSAFPSLRLVAVSILLVSCQESISAPGMCPEFCPSGGITVVDSLFTDVIGGDSAFRGYVLPLEAVELQLVGPGGVPESRGVIRFLRFSDSIVLNPTDTTVTVPVQQVDRFQLDVELTRRKSDVDSIELVVHRLPASVDSLSSYQDLDPHFADSTVIATLAIPDTLVFGSLSITIPAAAFPTFAEDSLVAVVGLRVRASAPAWVSVAAREKGQSANLTRFVIVDSAGVQVSRSDARIPLFDTFVPDRVIPDDPPKLAVGGSPSVRSLLRVRLPVGVVDSSDVVRATLVLVPTDPALGAPGDTFRVQARALSADLGPKSPIIVPEQVDTLQPQSALVAVGSTGTVRIDITRIIRSWRADTLRPRSIMLHVTPEGASFGELRFGSSSTIGAEPALQVTYVPTVRLGNQ